VNLSVNSSISLGDVRELGGSGDKRKGMADMTFDMVLFYMCWLTACVTVYKIYDRWCKHKVEMEQRT